MNKLIKNSYSFIIVFLLFLLKDPIYRIINIKNNSWQTTQCKNLERKYNKLLEFNDIDYVYESSSINTYVIYKDIYNYLNEITIRGGKDYGLSNNAVLYDNTLVGVIYKVGKTSSVVKLLTNKDMRISVKINDEIGVLEHIDNKIIIRNISNYSSIKIGDSIWTSGIGNIDEDIFIGLVKDIKLNNKSIEKIIEVDYKLNIKDIDYVQVLAG